MFGQRAGGARASPLGVQKSETLRPSLKERNTPPVSAATFLKIWMVLMVPLREIPVHPSCNDYYGSNSQSGK